jgi:hypothetical protein
MVGAGFSRNAEKISNAIPDFPLWWDVAKRLYSKLYPGRDLGFGVDVLRLGQEYEETYGRTALDDLIAEIIPDLKYEPGELHRELLDLPWVDLFTTNYDTLLERARSKAYENKYDVVLSPADIAGAERPRLVKLHGSFPSHRPFTFTSEDYRVYPVKQAPFVNMVQQSIMENALCLLGFSGEDPNFLQWVGWVRDQLGPSAQPIYLCGVLDLNASRRRYYESLRVTSIDLGPLFPESTLGAKRYEKAMRWILLSLRNGRPKDRTAWPSVLQSERKISTEHHLHSPLGPPHIKDILEPPRREKGASIDTLEKLLKSWRSEREAYTGWALCPDPNRAILVDETRPWISDLEKTLEGLNPDELSKALYEITWRTQRGMIPLPSSYIALITKLLEPSNLPPAFSGSSSNAPRPSEGWEALTERFVELAFAMLDNAWQRQNDEQHNQCLECLRHVAKLKPEWQARWHFADCWHHLLNLNEAATRAALDRWPENAGLPLWEAKRAAVFAELGNIETSIQIAEAALERVRQAINQTRADYQALSEEACVLSLLRAINLERSLSASDADQHQARVLRLQALRQYRCDPEELLEGLAREIQSVEPGYTRHKKLGFEPGIVRLEGEIQLSDMSEWTLAQLLHDGPWPASMVPETGKSFEKLIRRLWPLAPRLAISLALRTENAKALEQMLTRDVVATMDADLANTVYDWLVGTLRKAMEAPALSDSSALRDRIIEGCSSVLSRLTARISSDRLQNAFELATSMYNSWLFQHDDARHQYVGDMFRRVLFAASTTQISSWLPSLIALPVPSMDFEVEFGSQWPEPMRHILSRPKFRVSSTVAAQCANAINRLTRIVQDEHLDARAMASTRLSAMAWAGALNDTSMKAYVGALWSKTDATQYPASTGFAPWVLLELKERRTGESREAVARFFIKGDVSTPNYFAWLHESTAQAWQDGEERASRIVWTGAEAETLLSKFLDNLPVITNSITSRVIEFVLPGTRRRRQNIAIVISNVLIPPIAKEGTESGRALVRQLLSELEKRNVSILLALPASLMLDPDRRQAAANQIRDAIHSSTENEVLEGGDALFSWLALSSAQKIEGPPPYLLDELVNNVLARRQPGLNFAVKFISKVLQRLPAVLTAHHIEVLVRAVALILRDTDLTRGHIEDDLPLNTEERAHLRGYVSQLAARLAHYHQTRDLPLPREIEAWRDAGMMDPLPEVRLPWVDVPENS